MTLLLYILGIIAMVAGLGVSIALHEVGHLVPAKLFGVRVTQYMIGFGPTLFSRRVGETEYGVKAIPLGGYIRMIGMYPPHKGEDPNTIREDSTGFMQQMSEEAKLWDSSQYSEEDRHRTFVALSVPKKLVVMLGGPTMNLLLSALLLTILVAGMGMPAVTSQIRSVSTCVLPADAPADAQCTPQAPAAPAAAAGVKPGDTITAINGTPITTFDELSTIVQANADTPISLTVERGTQTLTLEATPITNEVAARDADGNVLTTADGTIRTEKAGFLGVTGTPGLVRQPLSEVPPMLWDTFTGTANVVLSLPQRMWDIAQVVFTDQERDPNGPLGVVGVSRLAGEVVSADDAQLQLQEKTWMLVSMLGSLNMALFVFNLIPLLPLDGGHVLGALIEGVRRLWARARGKSDPGPIDMSRMLPVTNVVALAFIGMSVLLLYADLVKPIQLFR